jgi:hypothetical protein
MSELRGVKILGTNNEEIESFKGAINVHDADVHSVPVNEYFHQHSGASTTLAVAVTAGDTSITVVSATGFLVGDIIQIENGVIETTFPSITVIAGNVLTLDRPLDNAFSIGDKVDRIITNMNIVASLGSPQSFKIVPDTSQEWHIYTITLSMTHNTGSDPSLFGNISALTNGICLRAFNGTAGQYRTFTNWKNNAKIGLDFGKVTYDPKVGGGDYGTFATASIKRVSGATPSLSGANGDFLEMLIQDDLSGLITVNAKVQGHVVGL